MRWTIQRILMGLAAVGCVTALLVGGVGIYNANRARRTEAQLELYSAALRQAMQADMMHDALRADVLRSIFAARTNPADRDSVLADEKEHANTFRTALADSSLRVAPASVQAVLTELQQPLEAYLAAAEQASELAFRDRSAAERQFPEFQAAFERLEVGMGRLGDAVEQTSTAAVSQAAAANQWSRTLTFLVIALGAGIALLIGWMVSKRVVADVREIRRVTTLVGSGDFRELAKVVSQNELGETGEALNHAIEGMRAALESERVDWREVGQQRAEVVRIKQLVENAPINIMWADRELNVRYLNPAALATFRTLEQYLPIKADQMVGRSIDIFHKLPDASRLPHKARIQLGPETLDLVASAMKDERGDYVGAMVTWEVVTAKLAAEEQVKQAQARDLKQ